MTSTEWYGRRTLWQDGGAGMDGGAETEELSQTINFHVGQRIRALRQNKRKTQREMGEILGMTYQQIRKYETGTNVISMGKLWILATYFNLRISYFFEGLDGSVTARWNDWNSRVRRRMIPAGITSNWRPPRP